MAKIRSDRIIALALLPVALLVVGLFYAAGGSLRSLLSGAATIFPASTGVLAQFEFNGSLRDSTGDAPLKAPAGGDFVETEWGQGLQVGFRAETLGGLDCSSLAPRLKPPFTIEIVLTPGDTQGFRKLLSVDDAEDEGIYYYGGGIRFYPHSAIGEGTLKPGERHYLAFVSTADGTVQVFLQGRHAGIAPAFRLPLTELIFFRDDAQTGRTEQLDGVVDALRISAVARSASEIAAIQARLERKSESLLSKSR